MIWHRQSLILTALVCLALVCCCQGCGASVENADSRPSVAVNGQTIDLKETEKEVVSKTFQTKAAPRLVVDTFGKITVTAGTNDKVEAEITKVCGGETKEEAKNHLKLIDVQMKQEGDTIRVTARRTDNLPALVNANAEQIKQYLKKQAAVRSVDAVLRVPVAAVLELKTSYGDVKVTGISGRVTAESSSGAIAVTKGQGELKLNSNYGDLTIDGRNTIVNAMTRSGNVSVKGARGPLDVSSGYGTVNIAGAEGKVTAQSSSGNVTVKEATGPVKATSGYGTVTVDGAAAVEAESRSGNVEIKHATGAVTAKSGYGKLVVESAPSGANLEAASGDIQLKAAQGKVKLTSGYGQINAEVSGAQVTVTARSGNVTVRGRLSDGDSVFHSGYGNITLTLPADSQFHLAARTKYGQVKTGFPLQSSAKTETNRLEGKVGEEPKTVIKVTADSGNIEIVKK